MRWRFLFVLVLSSYAIAASGQQVAVFLSLNSSDLQEETLQQIQKEHSNYLQELSGEENLQLIGAFDRGGKFLLFNVSTLNEIRDIISRDPAVSAGILRPEYFKADIRLGSICPTAGKQFVQYNFVRFTSHITKYNVQHVPQLLKAHDDYIEEISLTGNVLSEGVFANSDGGYMIIKGELSNEVIINDPTVAAGFTIPEIKNIWLPEGVFCDKNDGQKN